MFRHPRIVIGANAHEMNTSVAELKCLAGLHRCTPFTSDVPWMGAPGIGSLRSHSVPFSWDQVIAYA